MGDRGICPLCGESNKCASTIEGMDPKKCWCMNIKIPKELLDRVPEDKKNTACICKECIEKFKEENGI